MLSGVLDTESIIGLSKGGVFHHLSSLYAPLYVPAAVRHEVFKGGPARAGVPELTQALGVWITEVIPDPHVVQQFSAPGSLADREVLAVARERAPIDHVLSGDRRLYQVATVLGFTCLRTTEVLLLLKSQGVITGVRSVMDRMRLYGYGIDNVLCGRAASPGAEEACLADPQESKGQDCLTGRSTVRAGSKPCVRSPG